MMKEAKPFVMDPKVMSMHKELSVKSRVRGDFHARFCGRVRVKLPRSTRPKTLGHYIQYFFWFFCIVGIFIFLLVIFLSLDAQYQWTKR